MTSAIHATMRWKHEARFLQMEEVKEPNYERRQHLHSSIGEDVSERLFRRTRSLIRGLSHAAQIVKICNSSWRRRDGVKISDQRRIEIASMHLKDICDESIPSSQANTK
uniref:Uncharacterized protein n=1 Tax=Ascaris lumbricoides TaxID=6252 RepID=A0A0M3I560_ASCLU